MRTRVGYAGGKKEGPTYHDLGDHTETVQVDYDPSVLSYEDLLSIFWQSHDPFSRSWSRQYMAVIFFHDDEQKKAAQKSLDEIVSTSGRKVHTKLEPYTNFYPAENYHQKYRLKMESAIMSDLANYYPDGEDLTHSTASARINGFLYGYGDGKYFEEISADLGLSDTSIRSISRILYGR